MSAIEPLALAAILVMGAATWAMRAGGYWMMGHVPLTPRVRRMIEALPGSLVVAIVLPIAFNGGIVAFAAIAAAAAVMIVWRKDLLAIAAGLLLAVLLRAAGM